METLRRIALVLVIIGGINWGLIGFFQFDLVASLFGGQDATLSRIIYALVGLSALYCLTILFEPMSEREKDQSTQADTLNYGTEFGDEANFDHDKNRPDDFKK